MPVEYKVVIPTYKRSETLRDKTLALLQKYEIPPERIYIFVADEEEKKLYEQTLPKYYKEIVVGEVGMRAIRNFIQDYFPEGEKLLNMDDDIRALKIRVNEREGKDLESLKNLIERGFELSERFGARLWGVYPTYNPMFMRNKVSADLRYIIGAFWGVTNTHDKDTYVTLDDKEDFERTIKFYIKDGRVLRFNNIGIESAYYTEPGGMQVERTESRVTSSGMYLVQKYPTLCSVNKARKKHFEIKLKDKRRKKRG